MYGKSIHDEVADILLKHIQTDFVKDPLFYTRCIANSHAIYKLYSELYGYDVDGHGMLTKLINTIAKAYKARPDGLLIEAAGYNAYEHRNFLKNYYSGNYYGSPAKGALFSFNPKTGDARISGTLASLCGLETALANDGEKAIDIAIKKIVMMQAFSFFNGGLPMLFYGDGIGYTNNYSYKNDAGKNYDNRWMHRPLIDWEKNDLKNKKGTVEQKIFSATKKLITIRKSLNAFADTGNLTWMFPHNNTLLHL